MLYRTLENYDDSAVSHTIEPSCVGYFPKCDTTDEQTCNNSTVGCKWGVGACGGSGGGSVGSSAICPTYTNRKDCSNATMSHGCGWGVPSCSGSSSQCNDYLFKDQCTGSPPSLGCKWGVPTCSGGPGNRCRKYLIPNQCTGSPPSLGCKWGVNQ